MSEEEGNIDPVLRVAEMYKNNTELLRKHVQERNEMADKLNERVIKFLKYTPMMGKVVDGEMVYELDVSSKEILQAIRDENDNLLRKSFPDLYLISDFDNERKNKKDSK